jgi:hypothetical protein
MTAVGITAGAVTAPTDSAEAAQRVRRVVTRVCAVALAETGAAGIAMLDPDSPEGSLLSEWLLAAGIATHPLPTGSAGTSDDLVAHPACKTSLLLSGRLPLCDLLPLGDLWASQIAALGGGWSATSRLQEIASGAGGMAALDRALQRLVEGRMPAAEALQDLPAETAREVQRLFESGRWSRRHNRLVPKLTGRTLGIDLFD